MIKLILFLVAWPIIIPLWIVKYIIVGLLAEKVAKSAPSIYVGGRVPNPLHKG